MNNVISFPKDKTTITADYLLDKVKEDIDNVESMMILVKRKDGSIAPSFTDMGGFEAVGMAEILKAIVLDMVRV